MTNRLPYGVQHQRRIAGVGRAGGILGLRSISGSTLAKEGVARPRGNRLAELQFYALSLDLIIRHTVNRFGGVLIVGDRVGLLIQKDGVEVDGRTVGGGQALLKRLLVRIGHKAAVGIGRPARQILLIPLRIRKRLCEGRVIRAERTG